MPEFDQLRNNSVLPPPQLYILIISSAWFFSVEGIQFVISTRGGGWLQIISGTASEWSMWLIINGSKSHFKNQRRPQSWFMKKIIIINASAHIL